LAVAVGKFPKEMNTTRSRNETAPRILFIVLDIGHSPTLDNQKSGLAQLVTLEGHAER
jgi:hypothetical protein